MIDANSRLVVAIGLPLPCGRNDCRAFTESGVDRVCRGVSTIADGGHQGTGLLVPHRKRPGQTRLSPDREAANAVHRRARVRVEHALSRLKNWRILRDRRLKGDDVHQAMLSIARLDNPGPHPVTHTPYGTSSGATLPPACHWASDVKSPAALPAETVRLMCRDNRRREGWYGIVDRGQREYRKRRSMPRATKVILVCWMLLTAVKLIGLDSDHPWPAWFEAGMVFALLVLFIWLLVRLRVGRTLVGPAGVTTRGAVISRHRAWPDLYDIRIEPNPAGLRSPAHLTSAYCMDGRRLPLFFLDSRQCDDLPAEVEAIRTGGAAWRGMPWTRLPEVEERIRRRAMRWIIWNRAFICMLYSYLPALFVVLWRVSHGEDSHPALCLVWGPLVVLLACLSLFVVRESRRPSRPE